MSGKSHNKKRNTGLLYEFLVHTISRALVDGNQRASSEALRILRKHFKPSSELYREFRLINALMKTTVSSEAVAASILQEAKLAARSHDVVELDKQKSFLIKNINHRINDENFYDQQVNEFRMYATLQTLLNDWRDPNRDLERVAKYEDQVMKWLTTEKPSSPDHALSDESAGTSRLLMKTMMKRLNEKYSGVLNDDQKSLIRAYAFSTANDDPSSIKKKLVEIKEGLLSSIDEFTHQNPTDEFINKKLTQAREQLVTENLETVNDETVTRFMLYTKLSKELESKEDDDGN